MITTDTFDNVVTTSYYVIGNLNFGGFSFLQWQKNVLYLTAAVAIILLIINFFRSPR